MPKPLKDEATELEASASVRAQVAKAARELAAAQEALQAAQIEYDVAKAALADAQQKGK